MRKPELDESQRKDAVRIKALIDQFGADGSAADHSQALPALREISRDRVVLGDVLGDYLHRVVVGTQAETISSWPALDLLRALGADEERAAAKAAWLRHQQGPDEVPVQAVWREAIWMSESHTSPRCPPAT